MFGLGFWEMVVLGIVLIVVVGPKELPKMLRSLGQGIGKLRRMSTDLREQSGIDEILDQEDLRKELMQLRSLSRANMMDRLVAEAMKPTPKRRRKIAAGDDDESDDDALEDDEAFDEADDPYALAEQPKEQPNPETEYPAVGCDAYGAEPDDAPKKKKKKDDDEAEASAEDDDAPDDATEDDDAAADDEDGAEDDAEGDAGALTA